MKKFILVAFLIAAGLGTAAAQSQSFRAPVTRQAPERAQREPNVKPFAPIGAFPRAARGGNPLQLINPRAPQKYYGPPQDTVTVQPYFNRGRYTGSVVTGVILFGFAW